MGIVNDAAKHHAMRTISGGLWIMMIKADGSGKSVSFKSITGRPTTGRNNCRMRWWALVRLLPASVFVYIFQLSVTSSSVRLMTLLIVAERFWMPFVAVFRVFRAKAGTALAGMLSCDAMFRAARSAPPLSCR
ncbi:hypothetical protein [Paracoccus sp. Ld10]|uniref:hypothetical protein n=1 Tax=Paracoccus sp. Ld10 TaxID=649158 RepID=UPI003867FBED